jgi:hypothetical protein
MTRQFPAKNFLKAPDLLIDQTVLQLVIFF